MRRVKPWRGYTKPNAYGKPYVKIRRIRRIRIEHGMTILEVLMATGIGSLLALLVMATLSEVTKVSEQVRRQAELAKDLQLFFYSLEQYMGQTVQVVNCACIPGPHGCHNANLATDATSGPVFRFVYEDASTPTMLTGMPNSACLFNGAGTIAGSDIVPRGCKKTMLLYYYPAVAESGSTPSIPGRLELQWVEPSPPASANVIASLSNVTSFGCGMTVNDTASGGSATLSNSDLQVRIGVKSKASLEPSPTASSYESWASAGQNFSWGFHRTHSGTITFRNLTMPGIHFGKLRQIRDCIPNGQSSNGSFRNCCSGYVDNAGNCVANNSCVDQGAAFTTSAEECCSHMENALSPGTCL